LLAAGCTSAPVGSPQRLIEDIPAQRFHLEQHAVEQVARWTFGPETDLAPWTLRADLRAEIDDRALWLASSDHSSLVRIVNLDASRVDSVQVELDGLVRGSPAVFWTEGGEQFTAEKSLRLRPTEGVDDVYTFRVGNHPEWRDTIRRLRVDASNVPGEMVGVRSVALIRAAAELPPDVYGIPWRFEAINEIRPGFAVAPGQPLTRPLAVPPGGRLHFAYALVAPPVDGPTRFTVIRVDAGRREEIFSDTVAAAALSWQVAAVPLPPGAAGDTIELAFAVDCPSSPRCVGAFASIEARGAGTGARPNVMLISIDTLRAGRMSLYGNPRRTTGNIDRWASADGVVFENAVAQAPWTLPSHVSMLTGLNATTHGVNHLLPAPTRLVMLAERLRGKGYFTAAVTGGGYVSPDLGFWQGFDVYSYWAPMVRSLARQQGEDGLPEGVDRSIEVLDEAGKRPFFLLFHTYAVHSPYRVRQPYFDRFYDGAPPSPDLMVDSERLEQTADEGYRVSRRPQRYLPGEEAEPLAEDDVPLARAMYDSGVARADDEIGRLLGAFAARGLLENTIVILTSDHGEMLGEMGLGGHAYLYDANLLVPLVFSWPAEFEGGQRIATQVRSIDIVPTLLELLGDEPADEALDGVSLAPFLHPGEPTPRVPAAVSYAASSNRGISLRIDNRLKYTYDNTLWRSGTEETLTRLGAAAEIGSAAGTEPDVAELRRRAEEILEGVSGLQLLLRNTDDRQDLHVRLEGPMMHLERLKATGLECACARWTEDGAVEIRVPPGAHFVVQFEESRPGFLPVELSAGDQVYRGTIDLADLEQPFAVDLVDGEWRTIDAGEGPIERGLALWWQGDAGTSDGALPDEELLRQLRALGYIR
jgi:arylsulfatase A-like enzyme